MSGLEAADDVFMPIVGGSLSLGMVAAGGMWAYYRLGPKRRYAARLRDMRSLRDLLTFHIGRGGHYSTLAAVIAAGHVGLPQSMHLRYLVPETCSPP